MEAFLLRPNTAVAAVCAVHTVRRLSRECRDAKAREYLIRVERRLMVIAPEDWAPTLHSRKQVVVASDQALTAGFQLQGRRSARRPAGKRFTMRSRTSRR